jgi:hypothetical protein
VEIRRRKNGLPPLPFLSSWRSVRQFGIIATQPWWDLVFLTANTALFGGENNKIAIAAERMVNL